MLNNFITANIDNIPFCPMKGIYYIGQYGTSGYASAAKGYLYHYFSIGIPITWDPLYFDDSKMEDNDPYNVIIKSLINKPLSGYDAVIMHSTPDLWPKFRSEKPKVMHGKVIIGYCTWETNKLPKDWVIAMNRTVNEVWVPSTYNEKCFKESGVERLIRVVPHIFLSKPLPEKNRFNLINTEDRKIISSEEDVYTFYTIGELNARKGIDDLIRAYCETFTNNDKVRLIIKTHYRDYNKINKAKCKNMLLDYLKPYPNHPPIICFMDNMTSSDILALHSIGDCYIALTKSEGFGLTIFDAYNYNKKIITTGYGGHIDFLGNDYAGLVKYSIGPVEGMESTNYTNDQLWAYPDIEHAKELMKLYYENYKPK